MRKKAEWNCYFLKTAMDYRLWTTYLLKVNKKMVNFPKEINHSRVFDNDVLVYALTTLKVNDFSVGEAWKYCTLQESVSLHTIAEVTDEV